MIKIKDRIFFDIKNKAELFEKYTYRYCYIHTQLNLKE